MDKAEALRRLRAREDDLRALGITRLALFGSTARDEAHDGSDIDLAAAIDHDAVRRLGPFGYFGIEGSIGEMVGAKVDLVSEPARKQWLQAEIDRDRVVVF
ncbi:nucleotidyltransferase domain-containing protein [Microvirga sp. SRT01]|jgi:predicted nucleotidyltransferase|uniref:Nucleotidyltransferase domain-containing protein n=1 Tax=Sphingomonas longa TaxID=2778730 RepID=A0ABS2D5G8_9SPHN|nr:MULTISPECIES: nucleotidyltransferase domain-containing protein [Alphaproteobacteria]MBM6576161.1 nucleotidyltransferase domain-containing protein [Sphingomonas sp. BT552]MBR7709206.1 nucleotidyltransferase domain-containing protein [Microvirga sp. SRT01]